jgi:hypothetical protein
MTKDSYKKINEVFRRLNERGKLQTLAKMFDGNKDISCVSEDTVMPDNCSANKEAFFICNVNFVCIKSAEGDHKCSSNYILCPENAGYACLNGILHGCADTRQAFECATFACGKAGLPANKFECSGKDHFICNGNNVYKCLFDFKCSHPDKAFYCNEGHDCLKIHNCGDGQTPQQTFLCGYGSQGKEKYICHGSFVFYTVNRSNVGAFTCGEDSDFTCKAQDKFECTKNFGCKKKNKFVCESGSKYTCKSDVTCNPDPYTQPPRP